MRCSTKRLRDSDPIVSTQTPKLTPHATDKPAGRPLSRGWFGGLAALLALAGVSVFVGVADLSPLDFLGGNATERQWLNLLASRIPRTVAVLLAGASLALSGNARSAGTGSCR